MGMDGRSTPQIVRRKFFWPALTRSAADVPLLQELERARNPTAPHGGWGVSGLKSARPSRARELGGRNEAKKRDAAKGRFAGAIAGLGSPLALRMARFGDSGARTAAPAPVVFYLPHGLPVEHYDPKGSADSFALNMTGESVLGPLEPHKALVNVYRGLAIKDMSNHAAIRYTLTGNENAPLSIDRAIAKGLGTQAVSLGVVPFQTYFGSDMYLMKDATWIRAEASPVAAADRLFPRPRGRWRRMPSSASWRWA